MAGGGSDTTSSGRGSGGEDEGDEMVEVEVKDKDNDRSGQLNGRGRSLNHVRYEPHSVRMGKRTWDSSFLGVV